MTGVPVLLLHQTPRSGDEFAEVIELVGHEHRLVAMDLPGMGYSSPHPDGDTISAYAAGIEAAMQSLDADRFVVVGHHTGAAVAAQVVSSQPESISSVVLSSPPWIDEAARLRRRNNPGPGIDEVRSSIDGDHLTELWAGRKPFYPQGRTDLMDRFIADALLVSDPSAGHRAVTDWDMMTCIPTLRSVPTTIVDHIRDPHAHPNVAAWSRALGDAQIVKIEDGHVPLEFTATEFAAIVSQASLDSC